MAVGSNTLQPRVSFDTSPAKYRHWKLTFDGAVATLSMDVQEDAGLSSDYRLKLNSYDLGVDIELADAIERIRFEHPEVRAVVITSLKERIFCAGANIFMLRGASHAWKVNFCKFTNETRLAIEDASANSGLKFIAAINGICAGGGYELALACDELLLVDDGNSAVSLPETPLLAVLPGTGGLTRVVDKRKVRRDLADVFGTVAEGVKGRRAVEWGLVDAVYPTTQFKDRVAKRATELSAMLRPAVLWRRHLARSPGSLDVRERAALLERLARDRSCAARRHPDSQGSGGRTRQLHRRQSSKPEISSGRSARSGSSTRHCFISGSMSRQSARSSFARAAIPRR